MSWRACVLTLYPEMFPGPLGRALAGRALKEAIWRLDAFALRNFGEGKHRAVDDTPAGGGPGMVMRADVLGNALDQAKEKFGDLPAIYLSPRGIPFKQARARELAAGPGAMLLCGRFEGIDQRVIDEYALEEVSIGDFVLSGGELAAMAVIDACVRLLPGVVGEAGSLESESFEQNLLEYPHYTRPRSWRGRDIPDVLVSGDHERIEKWRQEKSVEITRSRRPDLLRTRKK